LVEVIVTIVLFAAMAGVGGLLISKLAPSYLAGVQAEQALSPREAALWRLSEDFRQSLVAGTFQSGCDVYLNVASGVTVTTSDVMVNQVSAVYFWSPASATLTASSPWVSGVVLNNVSTAGGCPITYVSGVGRTRLNLMFSYKTGANEPVTTPVSTTLYSHAAGPFLLVIAPACGTAAGSEALMISGAGFTGTTGATLGGAAATLGAGATDASIPVTAPLHATGIVSVVVTTPEGYSALRNGYRYITLSSFTGFASGGDTVTITGGGFIAATGVTFGGLSATPFVVNSDTQIAVSTPAHAVGPVDVIIQGISPACTLPGIFTYN
jgi:hypothetical protein